MEFGECWREEVVSVAVAVGFVHLPTGAYYLPLQVSSFCLVCLGGRLVQYLSLMMCFFFREFEFEASMEVGLGFSVICVTPLM